MTDQNDTGMRLRDDAVLQSGATDQRKFTRHPVSLPVYFGDGLIALTGTVVDISREGGRIQCTGAVPGMKYFRVEIRLDDPHETLAVDLAVMRWSRNGEFGAEFIRMEPDQQARLQSVIRNCEEARSRHDHDRAVPQPLRAISCGEQTEERP